MIVSAGRLHRALRSPEPDPGQLAWAAAQKFGASGAVAIGVRRHVLSPGPCRGHLRPGVGAAVPGLPPAAAPGGSQSALTTGVPHPYLAPDEGDAGAARRSLVLAGGGMRVAYQAGVMAALDQAGLRFHHVDGSSGGTINLSMVLSGHPVADICERWRTLDPRHFAAPLPWGRYVGSWRWPALGAPTGCETTSSPIWASIRPPSGRRLGSWALTTLPTSPPSPQKCSNTPRSTWTCW